MESIFVLESNMPQWAFEEMDKGNTMICNAPRPLLGHAVDDTWNLRGPHGRHFAAIAPNSPDAPEKVAYNDKQDARMLIPVTAEMCRKRAVDYLAQKYGQESLDELLEGDAQAGDWLVERGLDLHNEGV